MHLAESHGGQPPNQQSVRRYAIRVGILYLISALLLVYRMCTSCLMRLRSRISLALDISQQCRRSCLASGWGRRRRDDDSPLDGGRTTLETPRDLVATLGQLATGSKGSLNLIPH